MGRYIVTGGASGIGRATTIAMLERGDSVGVIDLNQASLDSLSEELSEATAQGKLRTHRADVSSEPQMEAAIATFTEAFDGLNGIVNNAAIGGAFGSVTDLRVEDWDATFAVVTRGPFLGIKHVARVLIAQGEGGQIVNVASIAGLMGDAGPQAYSVAKAAVAHMSRVFAAELAPHRISVNTVSPGLIETPLNPRGRRRTEEQFASAQPWPEMGRPEHLARAILFFASPDSEFITAQNLAVDGGLESIGHRLGTELGTNSLQYGVSGMNFGTTGLSAVVHDAAEGE